MMTGETAAASSDAALLLPLDFAEGFRENFRNTVAQALVRPRAIKNRIDPARENADFPLLLVEQQLFQSRNAFRHVRYPVSNSCPADRSCLCVDGHIMQARQNPVARPGSVGLG